MRLVCVCVQEYHYETNLSEDQRRLHTIKQRRLLLRRICGSSDPIWTTREDSLAKQMLPKLNMDRKQDELWYAVPFPR